MPACAGSQLQGCLQVKDELEYRAGVADGSVVPGLGPFGLVNKSRNAAAAKAGASTRPRPSKVDEYGFKVRQRSQSTPFRLADMPCATLVAALLERHRQTCLVGMYRGMCMDTIAPASRKTTSPNTFST